MKKITKSELIAIEGELIRIARGAGRILKPYQKDLSNLSISYKDAQGAVSAADHASEGYIIDQLYKLHSDIPVLAEEDFYHKYQGDYKHLKEYQDSDYLWVIDPLDGTNNFVHGLEHYCVCLSLTYKLQPVVGVIYIPEKGEFYCATKGNGAYLMKGKEKTQLKKTRSRDRGFLLATGFATEKGKPFNDEFKKFKKVMVNISAVRRLGSAAIDLCYVARGIFDGFWEKGLAPWDVAAGKIICSEAGAKVTEYNGHDHNIFSETIIVGRNPLYEKLNEMVSD
ncbi:inositol monophosphatase family protein [Halobacteriovorax sp. XZX-3]|uniref:inositol monophosphatase family protein n=1 Tax=unclassified Halobacteriovorax TaxID=2639665 RepID=UPI000CD24BEC|nr:inositol monophosphatase family protein [Halobacteriovorax sp. DA5]POB13973.1 inositol monophosphatase [Halobacteriovorax sp. DA5]